MAELQQFLLLLDAYPLVLALLAGIFGLMVGSFLNVVIHRLPRMMELRWGPNVRNSTASRMTHRLPLLPSRST